MINPFRRRKKDKVIDLVDMQKRGLLKKEEEVIDLSENEENKVGFLGDFAFGANTDTTSKSSTLSSGSQEVLGVKNKLDDVEYKVDAFSDRIYKLIERVELLESKLERLEGRSGIN